jgi:anti-sigma regulatory factor (Ser/Thr protein kinase)
MAYEPGVEIRHYILREIARNAPDISAAVASKFDVGTAAVRKHLRLLKADGLIEAHGATFARTYRLATKEGSKHYARISGLNEDQAWDDVAPFVGTLPENVLSIWNTGFTEMFNNAIDHSAADEVVVTSRKNAVFTEIEIADNGVGIFKKIQAAAKLPTEVAAIMELAKGKFTTDSTRHSGEGIFFTSKMFDEFDIASGNLSFTGKREAQSTLGTTVWMKLDNEATRQPADVYDKFTATADDFKFDKTSLPLKLALFGGNRLVSRSQARRIMSRIKDFKVGILDFAGVDLVGQAFADEIFRVFQTANPEIKLEAANASPDVLKMIRHVLGKQGAKLVVEPPKADSN